MQDTKYFSTLYTGIITEKNIAISYLLLNSTSSFNTKYILYFMAYANNFCPKGRVDKGYVFNVLIVRGCVHTVFNLLFNSLYLTPILFACIISWEHTTLHIACQNLPIYIWYSFMSISFLNLFSTSLTKIRLFSKRSFLYDFEIESAFLQEL